MLKPRYFKQPRSLPNGEAAPEPLSFTVSRTSRFNEVDSLGIVWHGHYAGYFEDARVAFGEHYGLGYRAMYDAGFLAPIKQLGVDYDAPLVFGQQCVITAVLFWNEAARLDFEYSIKDLEGRELTRGYTVQLFLNASGELLFAKPDFYESFCLRWKEGAMPQHRVSGSDSP